MDLQYLVEQSEQAHDREAMKAGSAYLGNKANFYEGFDTYKKVIRKSKATTIENKLEEIKDKSQELPWE